MKEDILDIQLIKMPTTKSSCDKE